MEYGILVKIINNKYAIICHGEYEKMYKLSQNLNDNYMIFEISKSKLDEIITNADKIDTEIKNLIQKKSELESIS